MLSGARAARDAGRGDEALALAREAWARSPGEPGPLFLLCCLLLGRQDGEARALLPLLEGFPGWLLSGSRVVALSSRSAGHLV